VLSEKPFKLPSLAIAQGERRGRPIFTHRIGLAFGSCEQGLCETLCASSRIFDRKRSWPSGTTTHAQNKIRSESHSFGWRR